MYALVDCNNFYVSCERLFNPRLEGRPVIVLSNNDGCAVSRSEEAKALGIKMATPAFMVRELIEQHQVAVFSSNYTLYGDISDRVMRTLGGFVPRMEVYSIDEAFLDLHDMDHADLLRLGLHIRRTVRQHVGIPVCVGIAATKTLAKMANRYAKRFRRDVGVHWAANDGLVRELLSLTGVSDIWGIGRQHALLLKRNGFHTALDLVGAPEAFVRQHLSVVGQRLYNELKGIPAIASAYEPGPKKNICTSKSFGRLQTEKAEIAEAVSNYAAACALKLRRQRGCCRSLNVFLQTNLHRKQDRQYARSVTIDLATPTNLSGELISHALKALDLIFQEGYRYLKCGVVALDIVPEQTVQASLFDGVDRGKQRTAMAAMDGVNRSMGKEAVRVSAQGFEKRYRLKAARLSSRFTTDMREILKVNN